MRYFNDVISRIMGIIPQEDINEYNVILRIKHEVLSDKNIQLGANYMWTMGFKLFEERVFTNPNFTEKEWFGKMMNIWMDKDKL